MFQNKGVEAVTGQRHSLTVNAALNVIRQCCGVLFPIITYPFVARTLGSESLGRYSFAESVVSYLIMLASLGVPVYAVREGARVRDDRKKAERFCAQVFTINLAALACALLVLFPATLLIPRLKREWVLIALLSVNIVTTVLGRDWINSIYEDYVYITGRYILFHVLSLALILLFIRTPDDCLQYTAIMVLGTSGGYIANLFYTRRYIPLRVTRHCELKKHLHPILYLFCITVATTIYIRSDITMLGFLRTDAEVGIYTLSSKMYSIVKGIINALIMVAIPRLSGYLGAGDREAYDRLLDRLFQTLYVFVFPCVVGLFLLSSDVITLFGGSEYAQGAPSLAILCLAMAFAVFACFYSQGVLVVHRAENRYLQATAVSALVNIVLNLFLIPKWGINGAALTTVVAEMVVLFFCRHYASGHTAALKSADTKVIAAGILAIAAICMLIRGLVTAKVLRVFLSVALSVPAYTAILLLFRNAVMRDIFARMLKIFKKTRG